MIKNINGSFSEQDLLLMVKGMLAEEISKPLNDRAAGDIREYLGEISNLVEARLAKWKSIAETDPTVIREHFGEAERAMAEAVGKNTEHDDDCGYNCTR